MKIYKVHHEIGEAKENYDEAFKNELMSQNAGESFYFDNRDDAFDKYESIEIGETQKLTDTYRFDGKLMESYSVRDEDYAEGIKNGDSLEDICGAAINSKVVAIDVSPELNFLWYAVQEDDDDNNWDYGSEDLEEAKEMAAKYENGRIAVIEEGHDPICVDMIYKEDF